MLLLLHSKVSWGSVQLECIHRMPIPVRHLLYVSTIVHGARVVTEEGLHANHHMQILQRAI